MYPYVILRRIKLDSPHEPTGKTRHYIGDRELPAPNELQIVKYPDDAGYYLLYLGEGGSELTDTYHDSVEKAIEQAEWEFQVKPDEWVIPGTS